MYACSILLAHMLLEFTINKNHLLTILELNLN